MKSFLNTKYEEVKDITDEDYFNNNKFSIDAVKKKYILTQDETYIKALKRVCDYVASVEETEEQKKYWSERWFSEIYNDWWQPAGSIMQGAGSGKNVSLSNCTTISMGNISENEEWDNLESIIKNTAYTVAKTAAFRQGLGVDFSRLRPRQSKIENSSNESLGVAHWMKFVDSIGNFVGQKGRVPAMLFSLICTHPDIEEFICLKSDRTKVQNANISVQCTNKFYEACIANEDIELSFNIPEVKKGQKVYIDVHSTDLSSLKDENGHYYIARKNRKEENIKKTISARYLLELISKNMTKHAEPGIQNIDIARKYSNSDWVYDENDVYNSKIQSSNACCVVGETKIMTSIGWIKIEDIYKNKMYEKNILVMSYNIKDKKYELKPLLNSWQSRNDKTVELEIEEDGMVYRIECSSDHKIFTKNRGYIEAASLSEDDDIMIFKK